MASIDRSSAQIAAKAMVTNNPVMVIMAVFTLCSTSMFYICSDVKPPSKSRPTRYDYGNKGERDR
jgi:hypothetical protein